MMSYMFSNNYNTYNFLQEAEKVILNVLFSGYLKSCEPV